MKQIVLDTETTGLDPTQGHRIIEIGCVEIEDRKLTGRNFQVYLNPGREIDEAAIEVHGLTSEFLSDKPKFSEIYHEFCSFIEGSEVIIHNAPFDAAFIDSEFGKLRLQKNKLSDYCTILDTLVLARNKHPGQRNSLDALCKRYEINNSHRDLHGALLDAEILADVYLAMTSGQSSLSLREDENTSQAGENSRETKYRADQIPVYSASPEELEAHDARLKDINEKSDQGCLWLSLDSPE
ncbi:MAG: DNA polymerase III subunit epsilon [Gammaproteobacteria bacterium]|nr:DNA polymerase III subunit epsilon [Gammaproteobacteria bacterium]